MISNKLLAIFAVMIILVGIGYASYHYYFADDDAADLEVVEEGDTVTVDYTGYLSDPRIYGGQQRVFDTSLGDIADDDLAYPKTLTFSKRDSYTNFSFTQGTGSVIKGWEKNILGMHVGQTSTWAITADQAYQPYVEELLVEVPEDMEIDLIERMEPLDFNERYTNHSMTPGESLTHHFWGWPATVDGIDQATGEVLVRNEPEIQHAYTCQFGWEVIATAKNGTANDGAGEIRFTNQADLGDMVDLDEAYVYDTETFDGIRELQVSNQNRESEGIVASIGNGNITIDFNSETYGKTLTFVVTLREIEKLED